MVSALVAGDRDGALTYLSPAAQQKYEPVFDVLLPFMTDIVGSFSELQRVSMSAAINRTIDDRNRIFLIYFLRDADGVWRIDSM
jgi:hypothetical protein